ncbi:hypothetical protein ACRN9O_11020, partial [Shewanella oncorhynchi]|uniref:hypothetical protein n=1 Tax=Shewanella oncorhynchi TaxID=2726434 RepID=UPI003D7A87F1
GQLLIIHGDTLLLWRDKAYHFSAVGFFYTSIRVSQLLSEFWDILKDTEEKVAQAISTVKESGQV